MLLLAAADDQALEGLLLAHELQRWHGTGNAGQHANQRDMAADGAGADGLGQGAGAAHFDHDVSAAPAGGGKDRVAPLRGVLVVDDHVGTQSLELLGLGMAGCGGDDLRAHALGHLQRKDGDAARAQHQHGVASLNAAIHHQRAPGGEASGGERGGFGMAPALGGVGEAGGGKIDEFTRKTVHAVAGDQLKV